MTDNTSAHDIHTSNIILRRNYIIPSDITVPHPYLLHMCRRGLCESCEPYVVLNHASIIIKRNVTWHLSKQQYRGHGHIVVEGIYHMLNAGGGGGRNYTHISVTKHWLSIVQFADHGSQKLSAKCSPLCAEHRLKISQSNYGITPIHILGHKASPNQNVAAYLGSHVNRTILIINLFVLLLLTANTDMAFDFQYWNAIGFPVHISHWTSNPDITLDFLYRYDCGIPILIKFDLQCCYGTRRTMSICHQNANVDMALDLHYWNDIGPQLIVLDFHYQNVINCLFNFRPITYRPISWIPHAMPTTII